MNYHLHDVARTLDAERHTRYDAGAPPGAADRDHDVGFVRRTLAKALIGAGTRLLPTAEHRTGIPTSTPC